MANLQDVFAQLLDCPYQIIAEMLNASALCHTDATCRTLRSKNCSCIGPWRILGSRAFHGLELEREGLFEQPDGTQCGSDERLAHIDWKVRFRKFCQDLQSFRAPFEGHQITYVNSPDQSAYLRGSICADVLNDQCEHGVYFELEVSSNVDNLGLAVVDFTSGGCSSLTFSPEMGAVIREQKVCETPRKVDGAFIQPLEALSSERRFHGLLGLYLNSGSLAFFRKCAVQGDTEFGRWETTGFVSDVRWAQGHRLTPALSFRNEGEYCVKGLRVATQPPIPVGRPSGNALGDLKWTNFDWEPAAHTES